MRALMDEVPNCCPMCGEKLHLNNASRRIFIDGNHHYSCTCKKFNFQYIDIKKLKETLKDT